MSFNFIVAPGTILKEYMMTRGITQKELAKITDSSERHVSNLINGKVKLTEEFALKLEDVFADVKAEFWLEIENSYRLSILRENKEDSNRLKHIAKEYYFDLIFNGMKLSLREQAEEMLKILEVESFSEVSDKTREVSYSFMQDGGNKKTIYTWLKLCEDELYIQNDISNVKKYNKTNLIKNVNKFKMLMYSVKFDDVVKNLRRLLNLYGIYLVVLEALPTSKIRGASSFYENHPVMFLSTRFKRLDTFYFAFAHELCHILNEDYENKKYNVILDESDQELKSNSFARKYFINEKEYDDFVAKHNKNNDLIEEDIIVFAKKQKVIPDIVLGFLEHDKIVTDYSRFHHLKSKM